MFNLPLLVEIAGTLRAGPSTVRYPFEKVPVPAGFRGRVAVRESSCIGCGKCAQACPSQCITMVKDEKEVQAKGRTIKRKRRPEVLLYRCIRCGLCEQACAEEPKAILLTGEFAGAGTDRGLVIR